VTEPVGPEVAAERTPATGAELRAALATAYRARLGIEPHPLALRWAWCLCSHETGGGKSIWGWNVGNLKASPGWAGPWYRLPLPEGHPEPPYQRAYGSLAEGCSAWWALILGPRYAAVMPTAEEGHFDAATALARAGGYFTAPLREYQHTMRRWAGIYDRAWPAPSCRWWALLAGVALLGALYYGTTK